MTAISKSWVAIADSQVDPDSPLDAALMTALRDDLVHLREWLGASYTAGAVQNHDHDGVNSALVPIGANALRNGSFESDTGGWTTATFTGGTVAINTANAMDGVNCLAFTSTVLANGGGTATSNEFIPAAAGMTYSIRGIVKASVANVSSRIEVVWYNSAQAQISTSQAYNTAATPTTQTEVGAGLTAPANTRFYKVKITGGVPALGSATGTIYFDQMFAQKPLAGLLRISRVTATDAAWVPLAATKTLLFKLVGGGGGGAGGANAGGANAGGGGGGGQAGECVYFYDGSPDASYNITIGAGGAGGAAATNGAVGGSTSVSGYYTAIGGSGGKIASTYSIVGGAGGSGAGSIYSGATGGAGGVTNGAAGYNGGDGVATSGTGGGGGGSGGSAAFGIGAGAGGAGGTHGGAYYGVAGSAATANSGGGGGGGGGSAGFVGYTGGAGGAGGSGVVYVLEFS